MLPELLSGSYPRPGYYFSEKKRRVKDERKTLNEEKCIPLVLPSAKLSHQYPGDVIGLSALGLGLLLDALGTPRMLARFRTL